MFLNCVIVDDEPLALDLMEGYVKQTPFLTLVGRCSSAIEALELLKTKHADLLFLDIHMPLLNGIELSKMLRGDTRVIFTTAFEQYALEGFKVDALDYLLKPIGYSEFLKASTKAQRWFEMIDSGSKHEKELDKTPLERTEPTSIFIKTDYKMVQVVLRDITYVEGVKDYIRIHTVNEAPLMTLMSLNSIEEYLPSDVFLRVHRSFIVNIEQIKTIERNRIIFDKIHIPISDSHKESVMEKISKKKKKK